MKKTNHRSEQGRSQLSIVLLLTLLLAPLQARANTHTVLNGYDDGRPNSLRHLLGIAAAGDTITFAPGLRVTILLNSPLVINKNLVIQGPGKDDLALDGNRLHQIFRITAGVVTISDLSIRHGSEAAGGAIENLGSLTLNRCRIHENRAINGGGIESTGPLVLNQCHFFSNRAERHGGGVDASASLSVQDCVFEDNTADLSASGTFRTGGGGLYLREPATATIGNSSFFGNSANVGAGIFAESRTQSTIDSCTIFTNRALAKDPLYAIMSDGGGIFAQQTSLVRVRNTIVARNQAQLSLDCSGYFTSQGHNLIGNDQGSAGWRGPGDILPTGTALIDPRLLIIRTVPGVLPYPVPLPGSPVIDQGNRGNLISDQRGRSRPYDIPRIANANGGDGSDIGAVEISAFDVSRYDDKAFLPGSVREVLHSAGLDGGDHIWFNTTTPRTILLEQGELLIDKPVLFDGPGADLVTISGNHHSRVFNVVNTEAYISGITIADGQPSLDENPEGAGIRVEGGRVTFSECVIARNGRYDHPEYYTHNGGGLLNRGGAVTLDRCAVLDNEAQAGAGIANFGVLSIINSTVAGNRGIHDSPMGPGLFNSADFSVNICTVFNSTIADNTFESGFGPAAGIHALLPVVIQNSVIARNSSRMGYFSDVAGFFLSGGNNFVGTVDHSAGFGATGDQLGTLDQPIDPMLGTLTTRRGPIPTMPPLPGSPLIDAGTDSGVVSETDQRGRPRLAGAHVDIGAYEIQADEFNQVDVLNLNDSGPGSLREAIASVTPGGTITFATRESGIIGLTSGPLLVHKSINILGPGPDYIHLSGRDASRVFNVTAGTVTIAGLTIHNGRVTGSAGAAGQGGGVFNQATLTISNCTFLENVARGAHGANGSSGMRSAGPGSPGMGGAIFNAGTLSLLACSFQNNTAQGGAGGNGANGGNAGGNGGNAGSGLGGAICNDGQLTIINCTVSINQALGGPGGSGGLGATFDGFGGAGGDALGGALANRGTCTLLHGSVINNSLMPGAGGPGDPSGATGQARGGGVITTGPTAALLNSMVALNRAANAGPDMFGTVSSLGHNLVSVTNGSTGWLATDLTGSAAAPRDPRLGAFERNSGSTPNYALQPDSPAINAGDNSSLAAPWFLSTDQRGFPRRSSTHVDIGAYELFRDRPTYQVTKVTDSGLGSLRVGIMGLVRGGTITFAPDLEGTIYLAGTELTIDRDMTIIGPGADRLTVNGEHDSRVFHITAGRVRISGLTIEDGMIKGTNRDDSVNAQENGLFGEDAAGGGILNSGDLTLADCMVNDCVVRGGSGGKGGPHFGVLAPGAGGAGGGAFGGAIYNRNRLTLLRCTLFDNACVGGNGGEGGDDWHRGPTPGGIGGQGGSAAGAGVFNTGTMFVTNCTIATNIVTAGNGGRGGPGLPSGGQGGASGAGYGAGLADEGETKVVSRTICGNESLPGLPAPGGAGNPFAGAIGALGVVVIGGFYHDANIQPPAYVRNTIIAGNVAEVATDLGGGFTSGGFNFISTINDGTFVAAFFEPTDIVGLSPARLDPRLGELNYHGGSTLVLPLMSDSPALDKGQASGATTDQRGEARPVNYPSIANAAGGDGADIGAFESDLPRFLRIRRVSAGIELTFTTRLGLLHIVEATPSLVGGPWLSTGLQVSGTGSSVTVIDPSPNSREKFYRLRLQ